MSQPAKPVALVILDGWGLREEKRGNAIAQANTPNFVKYQETYPATQLDASGEQVGLPAGQMGNSEVGHLNIGAGRVVYQDLTRITRATKDQSFFANPVLNEAMDKALAKGAAVHLMGLLSDGGVHSHIEHLFALIDMAQKKGVKDLYVHCFLDGRDVPPTNAKEYIVPLEQKLKHVCCGQIATVMGRFYAMDRDQRWDRVEQAYHAMVEGQGEQYGTAMEALEAGYQREENDEFVKPSVIVAEGKPVGSIKDGDSVIFYNFRPDRAREITRALVDKEFDGFKRAVWPQVNFVCMTEYDKTIPAPVAFTKDELQNTLGQVLANHGKTQLRIAETEKYAHVTFFFNGGVETPYPGEERILIPSPKVATYDACPEMSANQVTDAVVEQIKANKFDAIIMNYANPDMVGHTGCMDSAVTAVEVVDKNLGRVVEAVLAQGGAVIITADHGNAEVMKDDEGNTVTAHSTHCVPFILVSDDLKTAKLRTGGRLEDIAPTMLSLLGIAKPSEMTGNSLLQ